MNILNQVNPKISIGIITFQDGYNRGSCDFYPLIKWKKEFRKCGIQFKFYKSHENTDLFNRDIVCIDHRYYRHLIVHKNIYNDKRFIKDLIENLKSKGIKVILFDNGDGAGGRQWELIQHVDILVKKQVLKNKYLYTRNKGAFSYMPFTEKYDLSDLWIKKNMQIKDLYKPCPADQLHKIKLGWNIGMKDYRFFPLHQYYPIGTSRLFNNLYPMPFFCEVDKERVIGSSFRGAVKKNNENYAFQRNKVIELFGKSAHLELKTGGIISKKKYLNELKNSKTCVSPFGWGEVCYRDFEAVISGALLIKPDMGHLETFPDIYIKNETYVPLRWDMKDLEETLHVVLNNYENYLPLIHNAQKIYKKALNSPDLFINHVMDIFDLN